jgi:hypothetical protein
MLVAFDSARAQGARPVDARDPSRSAEVVVLVRVLQSAFGRECSGSAADRDGGDTLDAGADELFGLKLIALTVGGGDRGALLLDWPRI